ncbi:MAG: triose-phosphate isomerase, partial [Bdellovibrionales bacterium]|nr:triose-phosphate isomerase [Bdellovibrionales bacterium]
WKLNKSPQESLETINELLELVPKQLHSQVLVFPQNFSVGVLASLLSKTSMTWGSQNIHPENEGAFTGENSPKILKEMGGTHALVGHSERRHLFGETNDFLARKVSSAQKERLTPVYCVGETLEEREANKTKAVLEEQLKVGLQFCDFQKPIIIAYEPVWAIGTGKVANAEQVLEAHAFIRNYLKEMTQADFAEKTPILYGGSVKADNAGVLSKIANVNGFLVGGASLKADSFHQIIQASL